ncbi:MAG TPA: YihY/virulence factor BrkB family protein [Nitriliruptorales bacterium]
MGRAYLDRPAARPSVRPRRADVTRFLLPSGRDHHLPDRRADGIDKDKLRQRLPGWLRPGGELVVDTVWDAFEDRVPGLAAEVAFYLILSLPPLLLTLLTSAALVGNRILGTEDFRIETRAVIGDVVGTFLSDGTTQDLMEVADTAMTDAGGGLLSIGFVLTLLTASRALRVLTVAITIAYDLEDARPSWVQFAYGLGLTMAGLVLGMAVIPVFVAGPDAGTKLAELLSAPPQFGELYRLLYWPVSALLATSLLAVLYHVAAPWWTPWRRDLPGAVLGMLVGLAGSGALRAYTSHSISTDELFNPFATTLVILLWLYVVAFGILLGAELNAEIEKRWPTREGPLPTPAPPAGERGTPAPPASERGTPPPPASERGTGPPP